MTPKGQKDLTTPERDEATHAITITVVRIAIFALIMAILAAMIFALALNG